MMAQPKPSTMRSLATEKYCKPEEYMILQLPVPEVKASDEILIRVHAASINPIDIKVATGMMKMIRKSNFPYKFAYDLSGTVIAVGSEVPAHLKPGTEVYSRVPEHHMGTASEYALSTVSATTPKPTSISHIEAASIPLASLTALQAIDIADTYITGGLKNKTVYVPGGLSGTGSTAVQLAKKEFGAAKVITTLSTSKIAKVDVMFGKDVLDQIIDHTKEDPGKVIAAGSVDFMFDTMGQALASLHLMKRGGMIVSVASLPFGPELKTHARDIPAGIRWTLNAIGAVGRYRAGRYGVEYRFCFMRGSTTDLDRLGKWIDQGKLNPVVGRVSKLDDLEDVKKGCQKVLSGKGGIGKFVIEI